MKPIASLARHLAHDCQGASAVEFALALPIMLVVYLGTYQVGQAASAYRKMTITAHTVVDLASQYTTMSEREVSNVLNASAQVMAPFASSGLAVVLSEITVDGSGKATVAWSRALNATPLTQGAPFALPPNITSANSSVLLSQVVYSYTPVVGYKLTGPVTMSDHLYMNPRQVQTITIAG